MWLDILKYSLLVICGYMFGNISWAKIISKLRKDDITKHGSGNPGTMNMLRTYGFKLGFFTLILDALKGAIPSLAGYFLFGGDGSSGAYIGLFVGGLSSIIGHCFPVIYKFKGGKGVACMVGMFAVAEPYWALIAFAVCFIYLIIFDYAALTSFLFITGLTLVEAYRFRGNVVITVLLFVLYFLVWFMHRQNIVRLLIGKENKVNFIKRIKDKRKNKQPKQEKKQDKIEAKQREIG